MKFFKKSILALAALGFVAAGAFGLDKAQADDHGHNAPQIGQTAPVFTATDSNGNTHNLVDFRGQYVVLEWTNHECPFVVKHYKNGDMQRLQTERGDDVVWLKILSSAEGQQGHLTGEQANALAAEQNSQPTAILLDPTGEIGRKYDARTTPHMFVIDKDGTLAYMGAIDDDSSANADKVPTATNYVTAALTALRAGEAVATPSTRPYGCGIKYAK